MCQHYSALETFQEVVGEVGGNKKRGVLPDTVETRWRWRRRWGKRARMGLEAGLKKERKQCRSRKKLEHMPPEPRLKSRTPLELSINHKMARVAQKRFFFSADPINKSGRIRIAVTGSKHQIWGLRLRFLILIGLVACADVFGCPRKHSLNNCVATLI